MNDAPYDSMELMKRIHEVIEKDANNNLMRYGITFAQLHMLMALAMEGEPGGEAMKLKDLERYFQVAQSTAAGIAVRLERKGLVHSFTDACDKRNKRLQITERGREVCRVAHDSMEETRRRVFSSLTPEEQAEFSRLLLKVYHALI